MTKIPLTCFLAVSLCCLGTLVVFLSLQKPLNTGFGIIQFTILLKKIQVSWGRIRSLKSRHKNWRSYLIRHFFFGNGSVLAQTTRLHGCIDFSWCFLLKRFLFPWQSQFCFCDTYRQLWDSEMNRLEIHVESAVVYMYYEEKMKSVLYHLKGQDVCAWLWSRGTIIKWQICWTVDQILEYWWQCHHLRWSTDCK